MWGAVRPYTGRLVLAAVAGTAAEVCGLGLVAAAAWLIARAAQQPTMAALSLAIVAVRGFALGKGGLRYVERLAGHDVALRALAELRGRVFDALAASPASSGTGRERAGERTGGRAGGRLRDGEALTRLVADVEAVQDLLLRCLLPTVAAAVCAAAGVAVTAWASPRAALVVAAGVLAAGLVLPLVAVARGGRAAARAAAARQVLAVRGLDVVEGAADLAMFGATGRFVAAADAAAADLERAERSMARLTGAVTAAGVVVQGMTALAAAWAAIGAGGDQVRVAVAALTALVAVEAVLPVAAAAQRLREVWPSYRRVTDLVAAPPAPSPARPRPVPPGPLAVELLGVSVVHPDSTAALRRVDLRIERGRRVAIVGASGAGKSTLLAAAAGHLAPTSGTVRLADHPLDAYAPAGLRAAVRGLTQDAHVFAGTLRANLLLARPDATDAQLATAARRARLTEVVQALPEGWDTMVGAGGVGLSGGQRQRLLLARALLSDPPVLLLDEPVEALDVACADEVVTDLLSAPGGGTLLLVTHRLAALRHADEVVVMDGGQIVQRGHHDELCARPGPYRDLWEAELLTA